MPDFVEAADFKLIYEAVPIPTLILTPDLTIVAVNDAYLRVTLTKREDIVGRKLFDVFPDNPKDPAANGVRNLRASLDCVIASLATDTMPVQKYDIPLPTKTDSGFQERYWSPINIPVCRDGKLVYIIHWVEDVTEFVKLQQDRREAAEASRLRADELALEIFTHSQRLGEAQAELRAAYGKLQAEYDRDRRILQALERPLKFTVAEDAFPNMSVATIYSAVEEEGRVGGDFYDVVQLTDGRVAFVLGDVCGKGVEAAAQATEVRDALRALLRIYPSYAGPTMTLLNDYMVDTQTIDQRYTECFVAVILAIISADRSAISIAAAGIDAPLILRKDGAVERPSAGQPPLSVREHELYREITLDFHPGDLLMLHTDGLSEARRGTDMLGTNGVEELVKRALSQPTVYALGESVLAGAREFAGGALQDDACLILVRRN